jgi:hypothetical protein
MRINPNLGWKGEEVAGSQQLLAVKKASLRFIRGEIVSITEGKKDLEK